MIHNNKTVLRYGLRCHVWFTVSCMVYGVICNFKSLLDLATTRDILIQGLE